MPGLMVTFGAADPHLQRQRHDRGLARLLRHEGLAAETLVESDHWALTSFVTQRTRLRPPSAAPTGAPRALFHGVLHNEAALRAEYGGAPGIGGLLVSMYLRDGDAFVARLEGEFCLSVVDPRERRVLVSTDPLGNYPLYWTQDTHGLVVASEMGAVLHATGAPVTLDMRAVADYLTIGAVFNDKTLAASVRLLSPGATLACSQGRPAQLSVYSRVESLFHGKAAGYEDYLAQVESSLRTAVTRATVTDGVLGLSLSGGLDSRGLLAAIPGDKRRLRSYTLGVEGCADQVIGARLAQVAGTQHRFFKLDASYLRDFLPNMRAMVSLTDGMYLSHGLTEMLAVRFLEDTGIDVLLRGHGGELAKASLAWPLHTDERVRTMTALDDVVPYLARRANYVSPQLGLDEILTPEAAGRAGEGSRASFAEALSGTGLSPAEACSFLYLKELNRRFTVPSLELFRVHREVRLPYLDVGFLKVLLSAPAAWRDDTTIHRRLIAAGGPALLRIRNSNTSARVNAGRYEEFLCEKAGTVLKRLGVHGFRHYHNFDGWMRNMLLSSVEEELMGSHARVQTFVSRDTLARLGAATRSGRSDHSYLLQVLLIIELWMREFDVGSLG